jgi:phosphatidylserine/phosphatidylglycerophosphate/cardiolipin synthase-like enzyme
VTGLVDGASYFSRLRDTLSGLRSGDLVLFTDWRGDADERLGGVEGTELGTVLTGLLERGVDVRGLVWRSHPDDIHLSEEEAIHLGETVNEAGEVLLDERVRRAGSHHQKLVLVHHAGREDEDVAFAGGIDLCHGRRDDENHRGDPQAIALDERYGDTPGWHDLQLEIPSMSTPRRASSTTCGRRSGPTTSTCAPGPTTPSSAVRCSTRPTTSESPAIRRGWGMEPGFSLATFACA